MNTPWIVSCNIRHFDICKHFNTNEDVIWRKIGDIREEDIVYVYLASPIKKLCYKTTVVDAQIPEPLVREMFPYALPVEEPLHGGLKFMQLHLLEDISKKGLTYQALCKAGLTQIRRQCRISDTVMAFINSQDREEEDVNG